MAEIRDTPWVAWVEFPRQQVVAPAGAFLKQMIALAIVFLAASGLIVWVVAARRPSPLETTRSVSLRVDMTRWANWVEPST